MPPKAKVNYSGALVPSGQEYIRDSWEKVATGGPSLPLKFFFGKTKTTMKVKPIYNMIRKVSVFGKYIAQYHWKINGIMKYCKRFSMLPVTKVAVKSLSS